MNKYHSYCIVIHDRKCIFLLLKLVSNAQNFDWGFAWWICLGLLGENPKIVFALGLIITLLGVRTLNILFV